MSKQAEGVGAILVVGEYPDKYVFLPSGDENGGKEEEWGGYKSGFHEDKLELIGGAKGENETKAQALIREAGEERELTFGELQMEWLEETLEVHQSRPAKGDVGFVVGLAVVTLTSEQLAWLLIKYQAVIYSRAELKALGDDDKLNFRPFAWGVINLLVNGLGGKSD